MILVPLSRIQCKKTDITWVAICILVKATTIQSKEDYFHLQSFMFGAIELPALPFAYIDTTKRPVARLHHRTERVLIFVKLVRKKKNMDLGYRAACRATTVGQPKKLGWLIGYIEGYHLSRSHLR